MDEAPGKDGIFQMRIQRGASQSWTQLPENSHVAVDQPDTP
jgi:hypothetical protein